MLASYEVASLANHSVKLLFIANLAAEGHFVTTGRNVRSVGVDKIPLLPVLFA